ncbi:MAG: M14 family metallopeptidase [Bacteroidota bacterium]
MKKIYLLLCIIWACSPEKKENPTSDFDFETRYERSNATETATYQETITYFEALADTHAEIHMQAIGKTDSGEPLHLVTLNPDGNFDFEDIRKSKRILLINNGIHPGESDGIDATMMLYRDIAEGKIKMPESTVICNIPIYNIGGSLNRNSTSRTNQNGPESSGFRGNARNYDLNRDFIKSDTRNTTAFAEIFHLVKPDVFIDNHVSNGADYQYVLTHLFTQHNKLGGELGNYLHTEMMPDLEAKLQDNSWDVTPYVNVFNSVPEKGFSQFLDSPRYSTGYTTLWNTLGMMVETHMLKPYKERVEGTYEIMKTMIEITETDGERIAELRRQAFTNQSQSKTYPIQWKLNTTKSSILQFKGFEAETVTSEVTGAQRLKYNRDKPFTKPVSYQNYYTPTLEVEIPEAYIIPQSWWPVIDVLKQNQIEMTQIEGDTILGVESYRIASYQTRRSAYEGHYSHYNVEITSSNMEQKFKKGDYLIKTDQPGLRYLLETLEPQAPDSFFNWNFFDTILQQKEGFSPYVWEDKAKELLEDDTQLKNEFEEKKEKDSDFANNWYAQLDWLHKQSDNYEKAHLQYPVYRLK